MIRRKNIMHKSYYILGNKKMKQEYKKHSNKLTKTNRLPKNNFKQKNQKQIQAIRERRGIATHIIPR